MTRTDRPNAAATASEIRGIVGALEDNVITGIVAVGATPDEVREAQAWLTSDDYLHRELRHSLRGRAAEVFEILEAELPEPDQP